MSRHGALSHLDQGLRDLYKTCLNANYWQRVSRARWHIIVVLSQCEALSNHVRAGVSGFISWIEIGVTAAFLLYVQQNAVVKAQAGPHLQHLINCLLGRHLCTGKEPIPASEQSSNVCKHLRAEPRNVLH